MRAYLLFLLMLAPTAACAQPEPLALLQQARQAVQAMQAGSFDVTAVTARDAARYDTVRYRVTFARYGSVQAAPLDLQSDTVRAAQLWRTHRTMPLRVRVERLGRPDSAFMAVYDGATSALWRPSQGRVWVDSSSASAVRSALLPSVLSVYEDPATLTFDARHPGALAEADGRETVGGVPCRVVAVNLLASSGAARQAAWRYCVGTSDGRVYAVEMHAVAPGRLRGQLVSKLTFEGVRALEAVPYSAFHLDVPPEAEVVYGEAPLHWIHADLRARYLRQAGQ